VILIKNADHVFCQIFQLWRFRLVCLRGEQGQDWISYPYLRFFRIRIGFGYWFLKKLDQDRIRIFVWFL